MGVKRGQVRGLAARLGAHLFIGLVGYVTVIFFLSAFVFPGWKPFTGGVPAHAAYGPLLVAILAMLLPWLRHLLEHKSTATVSARRVSGAPDLVELELRFSGGECCYRERAELGEYRMARDVLVRIGALGRGVQRVNVEDEVAHDVADDEGRTEREVLEDLTRRVAAAPPAESRPETLPAPHRELEPSCWTGPIAAIRYQREALRTEEQRRKESVPGAVSTCAGEEGRLRVKKRFGVPDK